MKKNCPACNSIEGVREYIYGMPSEEPDPAKYVMGGCCPPKDMPEFKCINCEFDFGGEIYNRFVSDCLQGITITCGSCQGEYEASVFKQHGCER